MRLAGKVALITGAAQGIGREAARLFAEEGACVAIADIALKQASEAAEEISASGGRCIAIHTDVGDPESVEHAIAELVLQFGPPTVLYNNAGGSTLEDGPVTEVALEEFWRKIRVDLFGTFLVCRFGIPLMIKAGGGSVINTATLLAHKGVPTMDCYTAAKGGIVSLTRSMAATFAADRVRVNAISPGLILTERVLHIAAVRPASAVYLTKQPFGIGQPKDIALAALYLASDEARLVTGTILPVDSGMAAF